MGHRTGGPEAGANRRTARPAHLRFDGTTAPETPSAVTAVKCFQNRNGRHDSGQWKTVPAIRERAVHLTR